MGLSFDKIIVILVIAVVIIGPERLPEITARFTEFVKNLRRMTMTAKERMQEEMGEEFNSVDWKQLDPRQYDPRRIIRDALAEGDLEDAAAIARKRAAAAPRSVQVTSSGETAEGVSGAAITAAALNSQIENGAGALPFDSEAT
ncbi:twin-arginine translocase TatA/TatE family subunit [Canibacter zhoujuaniae]|uniref:twin-arginine translocase TatA/TatE family subunit n=1 Tax=Canibacter zhoujuaniae TaxID=2708343 RepID=UPI00142280B6|nr:twin-arginine translocase TatA/TatE family subunit [Canibacter zhoujuaniae]